MLLRLFWGTNCDQESTENLDDFWKQSGRHLGRILEQLGRPGRPSVTKCPGYVPGGSLLVSYKESKQSVRNISNITLWKQVGNKSKLA